MGQGGGSPATWCYRVTIGDRALPVSSPRPVTYMWDGLFSSKSQEKLLLRACFPFKIVSGAKFKLISLINGRGPHSMVSHR